MSYSPTTMRKSLAGVSWDAVGDFATGVYDQYNSAQAAANQSRTDLATVRTQLEMLQIERANAQSAAEIAYLDAEIEREKMAQRAKLLGVTVPVLLVLGGGAYVYLNRNKKRKK